MCAITQRNKIGKEKGDQKQRKSASGLPLDQQIRALFFFKRTDQVGLMTATNQCIVLNPSSSNAEHEVSHSDRWKAQSSLTRTLPLPLHMLQTNYKPTLYCLLNTQLQKVLIALDHLGFKSYYIQVQKDATKVFQFTSGDTYDEL